MLLKVVTIGQILLASALAADYSTCYNAITALASYDSVLSTRSGTKTTQANLTSSASAFYTAMTADSIKENGAY